LINPNGDIIYTVEKESDLGQNVHSNTLKKTGLAKVFYQSKNKKIAISDFAVYPPSGNKPNAFIAGAVHDQSNNYLGVVAIQIPINMLDRIVQDRSGLGKTGESYLVGKYNGQCQFRSNCTIKKGQLGEPIDKNFVKKALNGQKGWTFHHNESNTIELVLYEPLEIKGLNWAIVSLETLEENIAHKKEGQLKDYCQSYIEAYDYYDLFLINPKGFILYTALKEADYHTNMLHGKYADSNLGKLFKQVIQTRKFGFADFKPYAPINGQPAAFIAQPIIQNDNIEMVVALQLSINGINHIMHQRAGMGETGQSYLVGPDQLMRSDSFLDPTFHSVEASFRNPSKGKVNTKASGQALAGECGNEVIEDYNGNPVLSAYCPLKVYDSNWALIVEMDYSEAFASVHLMQKIIFGIIVISIVVIMMISMFIAKFIMDVSGVRTINNAIVEIIQGINNGDFSKRGDADAFTGNYRELVNNVNNIVVAFETPLQRIQQYINMISRGEIPEKITEVAKGDFQKLNDNLNQCIDAINNLALDAKNLVDAAISGRLDTRADASKHQGDFAKIVKGINDILDAVLVPIKEAQTVLEKMSDGDLTENITGDYQGDHALIKGAINKTLAALNHILEEMAEISDNVSASAVQLNSASQNLAEVSQEQAASVEKITASVHETDQQIRQNSENTDTANTLVSETNDAAITGQSEMNKLSLAINAINESAQNISKIIKVIDEIAFQTNILALNAAVEAVRAGQHGKGFTVVAQEVRNLAGRSAQAAKETAELIDDNSIKKAIDSVQIAERTGTALEHVVENVQKVKNIMNEIAVANKKQTQAMGQINEGMGQINTAVQNINSQSEETASAATQLTAQSENLKAQLAKFKLLSTENKPAKRINQETSSQHVLPINTDVH